MFGRDGQPDPRFPRLPNGPFRIDAEPVNRGLDEMVPNPVHAFWHQVEQVNGGLNNRFAAVSNAGGWVMGHYDGSGLKLWQWAREYTLADKFFAGSFGGSFINHQYLVCACIRCNARKGGRTPEQAHMKLTRKPVMPKRNPLIAVRMGQDRYASWRAFLDHAYWSVELG